MRLGAADGFPGETVTDHGAGCVVVADFGHKKVRFELVRAVKNTGGVLPFRFRRNFHRFSDKTFSLKLITNVTA